MFEISELQNININDLVHSTENELHLFISGE